MAQRLLNAPLMIFRKMSLLQFISQQARIINNCTLFTLATVLLLHIPLLFTVSHNFTFQLSLKVRYTWVIYTCSGIDPTIVQTKSHYKAQLEDDVHSCSCIVSSHVNLRLRSCSWWIVFTFNKVNYKSTIITISQ